MLMWVLPERLIRQFGHTPSGSGDGTPALHSWGCNVKVWCPQLHAESEIQLFLGNLSAFQMDVCASNGVEELRDGSSSWSLPGTRGCQPPSPAYCVSSLLEVTGASLVGKKCPCFAEKSWHERAVKLGAPFLAFPGMKHGFSPETIPVLVIQGQQQLFVGPTSRLWLRASALQLWLCIWLVSCGPGLHSEVECAFKC